MKSHIQTNSTNHFFVELIVLPVFTRWQHCRHRTACSVLLHRCIPACW